MSKHVNIGERYRDCTSVWTQWQVERVYLDPLGLPHAVMSSVVDDMERRTIACPTLLDRRRFQLVDEAPEASALPAITGVNANQRARGGNFAVPPY